MTGEPEQGPDAEAAEDRAGTAPGGTDGVPRAEDAVPDAEPAADARTEDAEPATDTRARDAESDAEPAADTRARDAESDAEPATADLGELARTVEALLFLAPEPVSVADLAAALEAPEQLVAAALIELSERLAGRGVVLRELAGGWALASHPDAEDAARRMLGRPRAPVLTPAQSETLAVIAYLQPISRPEIARIRGVASDSAAATLSDRGLVEEAGRSPFGAVLYRTTDLFLRQFGLRSTDELPDPGQWDPSPEEEGALRDRLLAAGAARTGAAAPGAPAAPADGSGAGDGEGDAATSGEDSGGGDGAATAGDAEVGTDGTHADDITDDAYDATGPAAAAGAGDEPAPVDSQTPIDPVGSTDNPRPAKTPRPDSDGGVAA